MARCRVRRPCAPRGDRESATHEPLDAFKLRVADDVVAGCRERPSSPIVACEARAVRWMLQEARGQLQAHRGYSSMLIHAVPLGRLPNDPASACPTAVIPHWRTFLAPRFIRTTGAAPLPIAYFRAGKRRASSLDGDRRAGLNSLPSRPWRRSAGPRPRRATPRRLRMPRRRSDRGGTRRTPSEA